MKSLGFEAHQLCLGESVEAVRYEVALLARLREVDQVIKLIGYLEQPELVVITRLEPNGSLHGFIHSSRTYQVEQAVKLAVGIADGLAQVHNHDVIQYVLSRP